MKKNVLALLAVLAVTAVAIWGTTRVSFDTSIEVWFVERDPDLVSYKKFIETFDSDQMIVLAWDDPDLFSVDGLAFLDRVSTEAATIPHVQRVRSLTSITSVASEAGSLVVQPLYDRENPPDPAAFRDRVLGDAFLSGALVSEDGKAAAVILQVDHGMNDPALKSRLAASMRAFSERLQEERGVKFHLAGPTILDDAFFRNTERDTLTIFPLMGLAIVLVILVLFRSPKALLLPLSVVACACLWVVGIMGVMGLKLTIVHGAIFPMLMGVGIASAIHVLSRTTDLRREGKGPDEAASTALKQLLTPCFFTAATTMGGLLSLSTAGLRPLRQFGILGAVGVGGAFLLTYALGPWLLPYLPASESAEGEGGSLPTLERWWRSWDRAMLALASLAQRRSGLVLLTSAVLLALALVGLTRLEIGTNPVSYYKKSDPARQALTFVDERFSGTTSLEILIDSGEADGIKNPDVLRKMRATQDELEKTPGVGATLSLADYVAELRRVLRGGAEEERRIPDSQAEVSQLLVLLDDPAELERLTDFEFRNGRITATVRMSQEDKLAARIPQVEEELAARFQPPLSASATGMSKLISNMGIYLLNSTVRSLGLAFLTVLFFMALALRSLRLGLFSMIPNLLPIGLVLGLMGWVGIKLDPGTAMIGAVALGLVVDDTVHFLHAFRERIREVPGDLGRATRYTLRSTGRAIFMTSVILATGFWLMTLASFKPNIFFGLLCGTAIAFALVATLVVLPAALVYFKPRLG